MRLSHKITSLALVSLVAVLLAMGALVTVEARDLETKEVALLEEAMLASKRAELQHYVSLALTSIADLAKGVAKRILKLAQGDVVRVPESLLDMAAATKTMVSSSLTLVANPDLERCLQLRRDDKRIDQLNKEVLVWSRDEIHRNVDHTQSAIDILAIAQRLERMADISTNVAEDLIFLMEGRIVRHGAE